MDASSKDAQLRWAFSYLSESCRQDLIPSFQNAVCCSHLKGWGQGGGVVPGGSAVKNQPANAGDMGQSLVQEDPTC